MHFCDNTAVNALLNFHMQTASARDIELNWEIDLPEKLGISDIDLCSIIGNILENAITACEGIPAQERFIDLSIRPDPDGHLYIIASNPFDGELRLDGTVYLSTHENGSGIGLSSISSTAAGYGGRAQFRHQEHEFYTDVVIPYT